MTDEFLDMLDAVIRAMDATQGDCDLEPEEDRCCAHEDFAGASIALPTYCRFEWSMSEDCEPDDEKEPAPPPGYLHPNGMWRGRPAFDQHDMEPRICS